MEWCEASPSWDLSTSTLVDDRVETKISRDGENMLRGSAVFYVPTTMRSAQREEARMDARHPYMGLRIARTLPAALVSDE